MHRLLEILLGIEPAPWAQGSRWRLDWIGVPRGDTALAVVLMVCAVALGIWRIYRLEGRRVARPWRWSLTGLRLAVMLAVVMMLLEPVVVLSRVEQTPANLLVLLDASQSMSLHDTWGEESAAQSAANALDITDPRELRSKTRLELAERALSAKLIKELSLNGRRVVNVHTFADRLNDSPLDLSKSVEAGGQTTGIGQALRQAMLAYRGRPVAGVLLVTDGQSNSGPNPVQAAQGLGRGVPVASLAVGTRDGPRNAKLNKLESDPVVFVRDTHRVTALVQATSMSQTPATLTLDQRRDGGPWEEVGRKELTLAAGGLVQPVHFDFSQDRPGKLEFRAKLSLEGAELTTDDNIALAQTRVIRPKLKVLFIAGSIFPEVQFLRNALLRDKGIVVSSWLQTADESYDQPGDEPIRRLPINEQELNEFDCILLYDADPAAWPANFPDLLTDFVVKAGGGLVYIAGEHHTAESFDRPSDPNLRWLSLLPVVREPGLFRSQVQMRLSAEEAWRLEITPEGLRDPIFTFAGEPQENRRIIENLPGMYWHFPVTRAKPGATVLARHGDPRMRNEFGPEVLLATQLVGPGRTFFIGFDSTYRWRYIDENIFDGFWARVMDRAGRNKQLGGGYPFVLSTDRPRYQPGQTVTLTARFTDTRQLDPGLTSLTGEVEHGDDAPTAVNLAPKGAEGEFEATFTPTRAGPHTLRVWAGGEGSRETAKPAILQFDVELPNLEFQNPGMDRATLESLAAATGGKVFDLADVDRVPGAFAVAQVERVLEDRQEIWDAPLLFGAIFLALVAEWLIRKRHRMI